MFHVCSISLNVTPNYVQKGSTLTLTCNTTYTTYRTTFNRDSYGKLASIISNTSGCYDFDTSMKCSDCSCDNNSISLLYKPQSTSNYSFNCTNDQEGNSDAVSVRAKGESQYHVSFDNQIITTKSTMMFHSKTTLNDLYKLNKQ